MSFYVITEGCSQVEHIFVGRTKDEVINNARTMIDQFHEYKVMDNEEIIQGCDRGDIAEFDLVEIDADWPGENFNREEVISLYNLECGLGT